jgi:SAM-dependent methyltransferase
MNHLGGYLEDGDEYTYMPDVWDYLVKKFDVKSVLDVGCGTGKNLEWFKGFDILGVEGDPKAVALCRVPVIQHDYTTGPLILDRRFNLCICTEFVEHVESKFEDNWFATVKNSDMVLLCHGLPGQTGYHHVNCQKPDYWIKRFEENGFVKTDEVQQFVNTRVPYGRNTLMLFKCIQKI